MRLLVLALLNPSRKLSNSWATCCLFCSQLLSKISLQAQVLFGRALVSLRRKSLLRWASLLCGTKRSRSFAQTPKALSARQHIASRKMFVLACHGFTRPLPFTTGMAPQPPRLAEMNASSIPLWRWRKMMQVTYCRLFWTRCQSSWTIGIICSPLFSHLA